jgi:internalin A
MTNEELLEVIEQAAKDRSVYLDLSDKGLTSIPLEIGQLTQLSTLNLRSNRLTNLPTEIRQLTNLRGLDLSSNRLTSLPGEIPQLTHLIELYLSSNRLTSLPGEISQLINLRGLDLSSNRLTSLPAEIRQLNNLSRLYLNNNRLTSLPGEIPQLNNLNRLYLNNNQLMSLPAEIVQLTNLRGVNLSHNQLMSLPAEIVQLTNLRELYLSHNQLTSLPIEIVQLTNLRELYLSHNQLKSLPAEIGQLTHMSRLNLSSNQLKSLPAEIGQLTNLKGLNLDNNPSLALPLEIRGKECREIINFYSQLEQETDHIYEAKLLIVGEGRAGKTTLANKIQSSDYQLQEEDSTQGIDVIQWKFPLDNGKEFRVNIWDFGGQAIYHTTHQFFLTKRSLYTLVVDTRKEDTDFYYWLNVVELLSDNSPLLIIKNEKQERQREINERQLRGRFTNLKETLPTNFATQRGLPEILKQIKHHISNLPHVGTELPKTWVKVREALELESRNHISLDEYLNLCEQNGFTRRGDKLQLSGYLHDLGVCLHFQEDELLMKTVILKPTWGTDAVYKVLDNPLVINTQGRFTRDDLKQIWHEDKYATMQPELLRLMMNFKLCYEIPNAPKTYIAPQLLTPNQPDYAWDDESENLLLRYEYEFMPKGILTRFIVEMHAWIELQSCVWKSGVILSKDDARAEVTELYRYHKGEIRIRVSGKRQRDLLTTIRHELDKIHNSYNSSDDRLNKVQRLKYKTLVPCNCVTCKSGNDPHFYALDIIHKFRDARKDIQCQNSFDMVKVNGLIDDIASKSYSPTTDPRKLRSEGIRKAIEGELEIRYQKLAQLRSDLAKEAGTAIEFQLKIQVEKEEKEIQGLEEQLNET